MSASRAAIEATRKISTGLSYEALVERFEQTLNHWQPATAEDFGEESERAAVPRRGSNSGVGGAYGLYDHRGHQSGER